MDISRHSAASSGNIGHKLAALAPDYRLWRRFLPSYTRMHLQLLGRSGGARLFLFIIRPAPCPGTTNGRPVMVGRADYEGAQRATRGPRAANGSS